MRDRSEYACFLRQYLKTVLPSAGQDVSYINWRSVTSYGYEEKCVKLVMPSPLHGQWEIANCIESQAFICQFSKSFSTV